MKWVWASKIGWPFSAPARASAKSGEVVSARATEKSGPYTWFIAK